ncbi:MAG: methyltransferase domain-containing protein [Methanomicrobiales archaeon]|nr:methyltransferase domain-containing protein [Methanomicrobiales archaeon]
MHKDRNCKNWVSCWNSSGFFFSKTTDDEQAESWNKRWGRPADGMMGRKPKEQKKRIDEIFVLLKEAGCNVEGARVLDVGSGPGATSIPFAEAGAEVTALDISSTALKRLNASAKKAGVSVQTMECSWWSADIRKLGLAKKFDLVFVTSTPAVRDAACFDRMIECSRNFCYYSFLIGPGGHMHEDYSEVLTKVLGKEPPRHGAGPAGRGSLFINGLMYLYLQGFRPRVRINHHQRNQTIPWEEAADRAIQAIDRTEKCTAAEKKKVREYYEATAVDGKCRSHSEGYSGMMVWNVRR